jgi:Ca2+-binding RTX toxin-like protein
MRRMLLLALGVALVGVMVFASVAVGVRITGTSGNDRLVGTNEKDRIAGGPGDDSISGRRGPDILNGDAGDDRVRGDRGMDEIYGGQGDDVLLGGRFSDFINAVDDKRGDRVKCDGGDYDTVRADQGDLVLEDCENVTFVPRDVPAVSE